MDPHSHFSFSKKLLPIVLVFSLLAFENASAQCPPGDVTLSSQSDITNFAAMYPSCTTITGNLTISGSASNLSQLQNLTTVTGNLVVDNNPNLTGPESGLHNIATVGGNLIIEDNANLGELILTDLAAVTGNLEFRNNAQLTNTLPTGSSTLATLGGNLYIGFNNNLVTNTGFGGLFGVGGSVEFSTNPLLTSPGLGLGAVGGSITIFDNDAMTSGFVGSASLTTIPGNLYLNENAQITDGGGYLNVQTIGGFLGFWDNPAMTTISGFGNLQSVGGTLDFVRNDVLTALPVFGSLTSIGGRLLVQDNDDLASISASHFPILSSVGGEWNIRDNDSLTSIAGFGSLGTITGRILIFNNASLASVTGLSNLPSVGTSFTLQNNASLHDLSGFANVQSIGSFFLVTNNDMLANLSGLSGIQSIGGNLDIRNNDALTSLSALSNVTSINGQLIIFNNDLLTSLDGLENIDYTTITSLSLTSSATLSACSVTSICNFLTAGGSSNIGGNATGCNSETEIENNCGGPFSFTWLGGTGSWNDPTKWNCGGCGQFPDEADDVTVNSGSPTISSAIARTGSTIFQSSGTLTVNAAVTISGPFDFAAGNISGTGSITVASGGVFDFENEGQNLNVDLTIEAGGTLNLTGMFVPHNISSTLTNNGTVNQDFVLAVLTGGNVVNNANWNWSSSILSLTNSTTFDNFGTLTMTHDGTVNGGCTSTFSNQSGGEVVKSTATGALTFDVGYVNEGTLTVNAGSVEMNCPFNFAGTINGAPGTVIDITSGTSNFAPPGGGNSGAESFMMMGYTLGADITLRKTGAGTFTVDGPLTIDGKLELLAGTISGSSSITVNGSMDWDSGSLNVPTTIAGSASLNVETASAKNLGAALTLNGPTSHTAGTLTVGSGGSIANGGSYSITGGSVDLNGSGTQFTNTGTFDVNLDGTVLTGFLAVFDNDGTFTRSGGAGVLSVDCDFTNDGTINHNTGSRLELNGIPVIQNGTINFHGAEDFWTGMLTVNAPFVLAAGQNWRVRRTTTLNVPLSTDADISFIPIGSANLSGTGSLTTTGNFTLQNTNAVNLNIPITVGGACDLSGSGNKNSNAALTLNGPTTLTEGVLNLDVSTSLTNNGTFDWQGGTINLNPGTSFDNVGIFSLVEMPSLPPPAPPPLPFSGSFTGTGVFNNSGTFQNALTIPAIGFSFSPTFVNTGILDQTSFFSTLDFAGGFDNQSGGEVMGVGGYNFNGGLVNDGIFSPGNSPGTLTVSTFENIGATLNIELDAPIPPTNDLLQVSGPAQLGGNLVVSLFGGFTPTAGDVFTIISASGGFGGTQFNPANITWPSAPSDWSIAYQGNDVVIGFQSALPVELVDFQALEENNAVRLEWQTASETNNRGFEIERSADGRNWQNIGFVEGKGTSTEVNGYSFLDQNPHPGINYYRLRQMDFDGQFSFSKIESVRVDRGDGIRLFPNPASGFVFVEMAGAEGQFTVEITSPDGRAIRTETLEGAGAQQVPLAGLPEGVYLLALKKDGRVLRQERLVVGN